MTDAEWERLEAHIKTLCGEMGLADWDVIVKHDPPSDPDSYAEIHPTYGQRSAVLRVCLDFRTIGELRANEALIHELLHCHAAGVQHHIQDEDFRRALGDQAYRMWRLGFDQSHENHIDAVSRVLGRYMPPLSWQGDGAGSEGGD